MDYEKFKKEIVDLMENIFNKYKIPGWICVYHAIDMSSKHFDILIPSYEIKNIHYGIISFINEIIDEIGIGRIQVTDICVSPYRGVSFRESNFPTNKLKESFLFTIRYNIIPWHKKLYPKELDNEIQTVLYEDLKNELKNRLISLKKTSIDRGYLSKYKFDVNFKPIIYLIPNTFIKDITIDDIKEHIIEIADKIIQLNERKFEILYDGFTQKTSKIVIGKIKLYKTDDFYILWIPIFKGAHMPTYTFECVKEEGGCGEIFEEYMPMSDYTESNFPPCPKCGGIRNVKRNFAEDQIRGTVETQTLGSWAEKNTDKMSSDQKQALHEKHHDYLINKQRPELPKDMRYLKDPSRFKQR